MSLKSIPVYLFNAGECAECSADFSTVLFPFATEDPTLKKLLDDTEAIAAQIRTGLGIGRSNKLTAYVGEKDSLRDHIHGELIKFVRGEQSHRIKEKAAAAQLLYGIIRQFGTKISVDSYAVESTKIRGLLAEFNRDDAKAAIELLDIGPTVEELRLAELEFDAAHLELINSRANVGSIPKVSQLLNPIRRRLNIVVGYIAGCETAFPDRWEAPVADLNRIITELSARARARQTRAKEEETEPPVTDTAADNPVSHPKTDGTTDAIVVVNEDVSHPAGNIPDEDL